jgi:hypothetical protein
MKKQKNYENKKIESKKYLMVNCSVTHLSSVILKNETILEFLFESILEFSFFCSKRPNSLTALF